MSVAQGLPVQNGRGGDQQQKEKRYKERRHQPFAKIEFTGFGHLTAFSNVEAGAQCSQSPITARERAMISTV